MTRFPPSLSFFNLTSSFPVPPLAPGKLRTGMLTFIAGTFLSVKGMLTSGSPLFQTTTFFSLRPPFFFSLEIDWIRYTCLTSPPLFIRKNLFIKVVLHFTPPPFPSSWFCEISSFFFFLQKAACYQLRHDSRVLPFPSSSSEDAGRRSPAVFPLLRLSHFLFSFYVAIKGTSS